MTRKLYTLTNPQKSIWITEQFYKGTNINNILATLSINCNIDFKKFEIALNETIKSNDAMRTKITVKDNIPYQYYKKFEYQSFEFVTLENKNSLKSMQEKLVQEKFDVLSNNLFKIVLFKISDKLCGAMMCIHHIISDAWSFALLGDEVMKKYAELVNDDNIPYDIKEEPTSSYIEFIEKEKEYLTGDKIEKDNSYWESVFSNRN